MIPVATTRQFLKFALKADEKGYNRRVNTEYLATILDPQGKHLIYHDSLEGDSGIVRTTWFLKLKGSDEPAKAVLDMAIRDFNRMTRLVG
jgi:hypothetical protein